MFNANLYISFQLSPWVNAEIKSNSVLFGWWKFVINLFTSLNLLKILIPYLKKYYLDFIVYGLSITSTIAFLGVIR